MLSIVSADRDNQNAVNSLIADAFRILGAMDRVDPVSGMISWSRSLAKDGLRWRNCRSDGSR